MIYQPPVGARDLFPLDVVQKRWIEERLQQVFHRWGYHRIITSTLERLDTLMAGGAVEQSTVIQIQDIEGESLGLRPELTASIARAAVTRLAGVPYPHRLYYNANVFRRATRGSYNRQQEFYQAGIELLGGQGVAADAEILLILLDCLHNLQLENSYVVLGEAGLTRSLLSQFPASLRPQIRQAITTLDRLTLESLPEPLRQQALFLLDLRGQPADVLQRVSTLELDESQRSMVNHLKALMDLIQDSCPNRSTRLILDLSLIRPFDYYTGIIVEVISRDAASPRTVGQGGRYDQLLSLYHPQGETVPGTGFVFNIEELQQILSATQQLPLQTPATAWLVVPTSPAAYAAAFDHAQQLRQAHPDRRVEVELGDRRDRAAIEPYARSRRVSQVAWVDANGAVTVEAIGSVATALAE